MDLRVRRRALMRLLEQPVAKYLTVTSPPTTIDYNGNPNAVIPSTTSTFKVDTNCTTLTWEFVAAESHTAYSASKVGSFSFDGNDTVTVGVKHNRNAMGQDPLTLKIIGDGVCEAKVTIYVWPKAVWGDGDSLIIPASGKTGWQYTVTTNCTPQRYGTLSVEYPDGQPDWIKNITFTNGITDTEQIFTCDIDPYVTTSPADRTTRIKIVGTRGDMSSDDDGNIITLTQNSAINDGDHWLSIKTTSNGLPVSTTAAVVTLDTRIASADINTKDNIDWSLSATDMDDNPITGVVWYSGYPKWNTAGYWDLGVQCKDARNVLTSSTQTIELWGADYYERSGSPRVVTDTGKWCKIYITGVTKGDPQYFVDCPEPLYICLK